MKLFVAIHVPEKFVSHPAFIDDFGLPAKKAPFSRLWWKRLHRERVAQRPTPSPPRNGGEARSSRGESVFSHASTRPAACDERILAVELSFVQITPTFVQHSKTE
jgi:hypothetical protein